MTDPIAQYRERVRVLSRLWTTVVCWLRTHDWTLVVEGRESVSACNRCGRTTGYRLTAVREDWP